MDIGWSDQPLVKRHDRRIVCWFQRDFGSGDGSDGSTVLLWWLLKTSLRETSVLNEFFVGYVTMSAPSRVGAGAVPRVPA